MKHIILYTLFLLILAGCKGKKQGVDTQNVSQIDSSKFEEVAPAPQPKPLPVIVAAEDTAAYFNLLKNKRVGLTGNATTVAFGGHLVDLLLDKGIKIAKIYSPEHGFRGDAEPGKRVVSGKDEKTGIEVVSLFGKNLKPSADHLKGIDIMVYDIQDVGCRFFTYISTMHNVMEACAENNIPVVVLDRPNPNIDYVAGPIRDNDAVSFVSLDPIPIVYGTTAGELANMINYEGWLKNGVKCDLTVIPVKNYTRHTRYAPPVKPSPNLPDYLAIRLYPSLCFFEATQVSVGRGTERPFTSIGYPDSTMGAYVFTPKDMPGMQTNPQHKGKRCYGYDFTNFNPDSLKFTLRYFMDMYNKFPKHDMINRKDFLKLLYGNGSLPTMLQQGKTEEEIMATWQPGLDNYLKIRAKYLIYDN
ncbi:MAG: DUF1343 domain-containing protein [Bacteroidales bacterium]|nr:DUF1343 domain-containing protein [Bacteroidales bacterium]